MKYYFVLLPLISLFFGGCNVDTSKTKIFSAENYPSSFINEKAVWKGNIDHCFGANSGDDCLISEITKNGSPEALKAAQYLASNGEIGYVVKFSKEGPVGIAEVEYPFRANTLTDSLLIPSKGQPIDIDSILLKYLDTEKTWLRFVKLHPGSSPWAPASLIEHTRTADGIKLVFSYPVKTCHACDDIATLDISYNFTNSGEYSRYNLVGIQ